MYFKKSEIADAFPGQPSVEKPQARKARRKGVPTSGVPKAWLVLMAALGMIVIEGAFRKWTAIFENGYGKYLMYFSKDIIFASLLLFPKRSLPSKALRTLQGWLIPGCALIAVGALISTMHGFNPVGAILTARSCIILPILVLLVVPRLAALPVRWAALLLAALTILNFALAVEQNRLPTDHILNRYSEADMVIVATESGVRATGTFSYITGLSILSSVGVWAGLTLMSLPATTRQRMVAWSALTAGFGCALASVSRAPVVVAATMVACWLFLARENIQTLARGLVAGVFLAIVVTVAGIAPILSELGQGMMQRVETSGDTFNERAFGQLGEAARVLLEAPLGEGFGTHQVGAFYASSGNVELSRIESQLPRMVLETGILGLIGYCVVCAGALLALQQAKRDAPSVGAKSALLAAQLFMLPFFYGDLIFGHVSSAFVWMILAAVLAAAELNPQAGGQLPSGRDQTQDFKTTKSWRRRSNSVPAPHSVTASLGRKKAESSDGSNRH
jgi:hypothetical protein